MLAVAIVSFVPNWRLLLNDFELWGSEEISCMHDLSLSFWTGIVYTELFRMDQ